MDIQTITVVIAGISVVIGVINSIMSNRKAEAQRQIELKTQELTLQAQQQALETRQAELFSQIYNRWNSRDFVKAYGRVRYKYRWKDFPDWTTKFHPEIDDEAYADFMTLNATFEGLGVLVKKGLLDIYLVEDLFSQRIIWYWEYVHQPMLKDTREYTSDPTQYDSIEYLYDQLKQRQQVTMSV
jgi:hypothetical protein